MNRNLEIGSKINDWTVVSEPFEGAGKICYNLQCKCGKISKYHKDYINRSNFSKSCRSCSQITRREENGTYKVGDKILNLTIIGRGYNYKNNHYFKVQCDCGHVYYTGHSTFSRKNRLPYCNNCFNHGFKTPKRSSMITEDISKSAYNRLAQNAHNRGILFDVSPEYLQELFNLQSKKCALSGIDIYISKSQSNPVERSKNNASLDRIDSTKGYIIGNLQWVHKDINTMKMHYSQEYFINLCKMISNHANQQPSPKYT